MLCSLDASCWCYCKLALRTFNDARRNQVSCLKQACVRKICRVMYTYICIYIIFFNHSSMLMMFIMKTICSQFSTLYLCIYISGCRRCLLETYKNQNKESLFENCCIASLFAILSKSSSFVTAFDELARHCARSHTPTLLGC